MRPRLTKKQYQTIAEKLDLVLTGNSGETTKTPVSWECKICGRKFIKSLQSAKAHPCICRKKTLQIDDYKAVGEELGLEWIGEKLPHTANKMTRFKKGEYVFVFSYNQVKYQMMRKEELNAVRDVPN